MIKTSWGGPQWHCDVCSQPLVGLRDAWALWQPLRGPADRAEILVVHDARRRTEIAETLLPKASKRPLVEVLDMADEALNR
jgi:hypothetical protein